MSQLFLDNNLIKDATITLTTGTANANFPLTNITHDFTTKVFRTTGNTATITVNLGELATLDTFAVVGSSVDGMGITSIDLYLSPTSDFTGVTPYSIDISSEYNFGFKTFDETAQYAKLEIVGAGSYIELSNIYLGQATLLASNFINADSFSITQITNADIQSNFYGNRFITEYNTLKTLTCTFELLTATEFETLQQMFFYLKNTTPFMFIADSAGVISANSKYLFSGYFYLNDELTFSSRSGNFWSIEFTLTQAG